MGCEGRCRKQTYLFERAEGYGPVPGTEVKNPAGAPGLTGDDIDKALRLYFSEAFPETELVKCAQGCVCKPLAKTGGKVNATAFQLMEIPEPIVVTEGDWSYTITGLFQLGARIVEGTCAPAESEPPAATPQLVEALTVEKVFKPKPNRKTCSDYCEIERYEFVSTAETKVTPADLSALEREPWLTKLLNSNLGSDPKYSVKETKPCNADCLCVRAGEEATEPWTVPVTPAIVAPPPSDPTGLNGKTYTISGKCKVKKIVVTGICLPGKLERQTATPPPEGR